MSRSRKKYPGFKDRDRGGTKKVKRFANKAVRQNWNIDSGGSYKKMYCSYDIHDYNIRYYSKEEVIREFADSPYYADKLHQFWTK